MASASKPLHLTNRGNLQKAHFQQTVCLADWWLVKAEDGIQGRGLAVAGFTFDGKRAMRVFSSAPILRRYDVFTVETTDGICVVLDGFMNKDRTLENGFPSDVCNYFVFGFPSYWKEYYEKFVDKESSSKDVSVNILKNPSPHPGMEAGQTLAESHEKDFGSQDKINAKGIEGNEKTKSSAVPLAERCGSVIGGSEGNLNKSWIASEVTEKESYSGGRCGEDHTPLEPPVDCLKNKIKLVTDSSCGGSINVSTVTGKDVGYSQINDSRGTLSACNSYYGRRKKTADNSRNVKPDKNESMKANFDRYMRFSEDILSSNEVVRTRQMSSLKMKQKNNQTAYEKVQSASVDHRPGSGNNWTFEVTGLNGPTDEIQLRLLDGGAVKCGPDEVPETPNQDKGMGKIRTRSNTQKAKATKSLHTPAATDNQMDKVVAGTSSLSKKAKSSTEETRRKLAYGSKETSYTGKEKVPSASPQPLSFNRSRSGRLLMPALEFWRNQIPVYDAGRTLTGVEEGVPAELPKIRYRSTSRSNTGKRDRRT